MNQYVINGVPQLGNTFNARVDSDVKILAEIMQRIGLKSENNITSARRLWKSQTTNNERRTCRPILIAANNAHFMDRCIARSNHLKYFCVPACVNRFFFELGHGNQTENSCQKIRDDKCGKQGEEKFPIKQLQ